MKWLLVDEVLFCMWGKVEKGVRRLEWTFVGARWCSDAFAFAAENGESGFAQLRVREKKKERAFCLIFTRPKCFSLFLPAP